MIIVQMYMINNKDLPTIRIRHVILTEFYAEILIIIYHIHGRLFKPPQVCMLKVIGVQFIDSYYH